MEFSPPKVRRSQRFKSKCYDEIKDEGQHFPFREEVRSVSEATLQDKSDEGSAIRPQLTADELAVLLNKDLRLTSDTVTKMEVSGKEVYGFQTPKKRKPLLAARSPRTPQTATKPITFNEARSTIEKEPAQQQSAKTVPKTPFKLRSQVRNQIAKMVDEQLEDTMDFSDDDSEYSPSENDEDGENESGETEQSSEEGSSTSDVEAEREKKEEQPEAVIKEMKSSLRRSFRLKASSKPSSSGHGQDFVPESDCYFRSHAPVKLKPLSGADGKRRNRQGTSTNTLDQLRGSRVSSDRLVDLMGQLQHSTEHKKCIESLLMDYRERYFHKWCALLQEGYSILAYGLGSKRALLQSFHEEWLRDECVLVVNGYFPSLTLKDILDHITQDILEIGATSGGSGSFNEAIELIEQQMQGDDSKQHSIRNDRRLFLLIHNIDGPMLRNGRAQTLLSRLSRIRNVHLVASIDHINTPLLWNQTKLSNFNFSWWDCSSFLAYREETAFENSLLVQNSDDLALASMRSVFLSLTNNARGIYLTIVRHQLKHSKSNSNYQGMAFKDLYRSCRESFLVSSDLTLRSQLTEFLDHKLVKTKRSLDGLELLFIPIDHKLLQQFADEHEPK